jgi:RND family efflux transporter MFP subunit
VALPPLAVAPPQNRPAATDYLGVILTGDTVELAPKIEGRVTEMFVKPGNHVRRGTIVAQLDVGGLQRELALAHRGLHDAQQRLARRIPLARSGAISTEELADVRQLVVERGSRVNQLTQSIAEARLFSPLDGLVAVRYVDPGSLVGPGRAVLRLIGESEPRIRFAVPEEQAGAVKVGDRVRISVKTLHDELLAIVDTVAPEVDTASRMIFAEGRITGSQSLRSRLSSGTISRVTPIENFGEYKAP